MDSGVRDDDNNASACSAPAPSSATEPCSCEDCIKKQDSTSASSAPPSSSSRRSSRFENLLDGLRADGEDGKQVEALTQLCNMLSMGTENTLSTFPVDSFVPVLVKLLSHQSSADIMLLAARAITHLVDVLPFSCGAVVQHGAVSCFVKKLLAIEYMDLAEQSLQALNKISMEHSTVCLRAGALMAVLSYLDFFSTGVQREALSTAANMCRQLPSDAADFVMEAVPLLTNLLQFHDARVLEHASVCLTRIAKAFSKTPDKLDQLCSHGLVTQAASLVSTGNGLSASTYTGLIKLLSICAKGSHPAAKTLLLLGISGIFTGMSVSRPPEQVLEIMNLANELLPPLPQGKPEDGVSPREKLLLEQPELMQQFATDLLPVLVQIYGSSVNRSVRYMCLSVMGKIMYFSSADMIQPLLSVTNVSSFLAGVLALKDPQVLGPALGIAGILMGKLPGTFSKMLIREGVVHAIDALITAEKENDPITVIAKVFREKYFTSNPDTLITDDLLRLKNLCSKLNGGDEDSLAGVVADILAELGKGGGVSTFEFTGSGVVKALLSYLTCGHYSKDKVSEDNLPKHRQHALRRYKSFVSVANPSMNLLIQKLQSALSSLERFPVVLTHNPNGNSSGLSVLAQPLRLRLGRTQGEESLTDYSKNVVLIDPLANLAGVESFLWPRIQPSEPGQNNTVAGIAPRLMFSAGGKQLDRNLTIIQAIQTQISVLEDDGGRSSRLWADTYTIMYRKADENASPGTPPDSSKPSSPANISSVSLLDSILQGELPCDLDKNDPTYDILALLRVLDVLNQLAPRLGGIKLPCEEFINNKLAPKLARQIQDALALCSGSLPLWCSQLTRSCPFLFPFETRRQYFYSTAFGLSRALNRLQQQQGADGGNGSASNGREVRVGLQRQKVNVTRNRILDSAVVVMEKYSSPKSVLEVNYFGEVGTGLGPTLEFYTLLSHDLQKSKLGMWISSASSANDDLVHAPLGLFPRPWSPNIDASEGSQFHNVVKYFRLLGRVMAKALQDGRLMDLPLSSAFYKLVLGQDLDLEDIVSFDPAFGKTLQQLQALVDSDSLLGGTSVEDLCLDFTLPGHPEYVLKQGGDQNVKMDNLGEYLSLVVDATVRSGIRRQMEAFRTGFNLVFDISSLRIFSPDELDYLLCGRRELWKADTLADHIKFDHGYTARSPAIRNLLEIMGELNPEQQRAFCRFVTGAPRLPHGGLAGLNPKLTIVRKHSEDRASDSDLPSVMTCANYLKLPPYSTKEIMFQKLLYAINEGQGSFDLS